MLGLDRALDLPLALPDLPLIICAFLGLLLLRHILVLLDAPPKEIGVRAEPFVRHDSLQVGAELRVRYEHLAEEVASLGGDVVWEGELGAQDILVEEVDVVSFRICGIVVEWEIAGQHRIQNNATGPDVDCRADVEALADDELGSCITGAAAAGLHQVIGPMLETVGEPKVGDDHVPVSIEEEVLEFEVTMDDLFLMKVPDGRNELSKQLASVTFFEVAVGEDVIEELAAGGIFEDDADVFVGFNDIVEMNDIRVMECLEQLIIRRDSEMKS